MKEIEAIREALAAGPTPGPWICGKYKLGTTIATVCHVSEFSIGPDGESYDDHGPCKTDADYIAACNPAAMAAVLAHIEEQQREIESLKRGEYICLKCCLRKDAEQPPVDF